MKIFLILVLCACFSVSASADVFDTDVLDTDWKVSLAELLVQFPSIFDRLYVEYNYEHGTVPIDAIHDYHPFEANFYDFDGDNIPEAVILFALPDSDLYFYKVYAFNGIEYSESTQIFDENSAPPEYDCRDIMRYMYYLYDYQVAAPETGTNIIYMAAVMIFSFISLFWAKKRISINLIK